MSARQRKRTVAANDGFDKAPSGPIYNGKTKPVKHQAVSILAYKMPVKT